VRFDALPLTPNGKRDRLALPPPGELPDAGDANPVLPFEKEVQACFAQVLQLHLVTLDADFFLDLGGHSLAALRVSSRLSRQLGTDVPAGAVFDHPSVRQLAGWIAERQAATPEASDDELLELLTSLPAAEREALLASREPAESRGAP
jgi:acyl carrier protein